MKNYFKIAGLIVSLGLICSCAPVASSKPSPLTYLALEKPKGVVRTADHKGVSLTMPRGGFYFGNYNFRPAADIKAYVEQCQKQAGVSILRNADIQMNIPFAFDILFFGYNRSNDIITIAGAP